MLTGQNTELAGVAFDECREADLIVDTLYLRGPQKQDDPTGALASVKGSGGFRPQGPGPHYRLMVMYTSLRDSAWPDHLDLETSLFAYHGDVKQPGIPLGGVDQRGRTVKLGNRHLENLFVKRLRSDRSAVAPHLVFESVKGPTGKERGTRFRGLAAPGHPDIPIEQELVAEWRHVNGIRFQNYRAHFCILDAQVVPRKWLIDISKGDTMGTHCPSAWRKWVETGQYQRLGAIPTRHTRSRAEQRPKDAQGKDVVRAIWQFYQDDPYGFEHCAIALARLADPNIISLEGTRRSGDGGVDGHGLYRIGSALGTEAHVVKFAMQAKCYAEDNPVVTEDTSRLISRLTQRQFGLMITTSFVHHQAYSEIKSDGHPIIVISAREIAELLRVKLGIVSATDAAAWLASLDA